MADGNIYTGKTGNPRISLTIAARDHDHLVKFRTFLICSNPILIKFSKVKGKIWKQYTLRFSSKRIAENLIGFGVTARKSLTAKVIGLQDNKPFWRGVLDTRQLAISVSTCLKGSTGDTNSESPTLKSYA